MQDEKREMTPEGVSRSDEWVYDYYEQPYGQGQTWGNAQCGLSGNFI